MDITNRQEVIAPNKNEGMNSVASTSVKYKKPNKLYLHSNGNINTKSKGKVHVGKMNIYITYDGHFQKSRIRSDIDGEVTVNSFLVDMSINNEDNIFDGWNLMGSGLIEGKDYIGTIRNTFKQYDFKFIKSQDNIATYKGEMNKANVIDMLEYKWPEDAAARFADMACEDDSNIFIEVDVKRTLVVGYKYIIIDSKDNVNCIIECTFNNISLNCNVDNDIFVFKSYKNEEFKDVTSSIVNNREWLKKKNKWD